MQIRSYCALAGVLLAGVYSASGADGEPAKFESINGQTLKIQFKDGGQTDSATLLWTGDKLMHLNVNQVLNMSIKVIDGSDYLFIETGGFNTRHPVGWTSPLMVLKRFIGP